mmetsp:Transcript_81103/g.225634  ORF Transcript_81103/g.225634 Transcript_81103/m.225634 type:complete len:207 (-) Transcript_81103:524-1144(-)
MFLREDACLGRAFHAKRDLRAVSGWNRWLRFARALRFKFRQCVARVRSHIFVLLHLVHGTTFGRARLHPVLLHHSGSKHHSGVSPLQSFLPSYMFFKLLAPGPINHNSNHTEHVQTLTPFCYGASSGHANLKSGGILLCSRGCLLRNGRMKETHKALPTFHVPDPEKDRVKTSRGEAESNCAIQTVLLEAGSAEEERARGSEARAQ